VIDLDVHQGNGTAAIFSGMQAVFTFSMHGERNYPTRRCSRRSTSVSRTARTMMRISPRCARVSTSWQHEPRLTSSSISRASIRCEAIATVVWR
jgi:hypothetical protein